jgi:radical SAM family uncharacterized protein/radical SAM-linked protein
MTESPMHIPLARKIDALLPLVSRPARYLDSEINAIHKEWSRDLVRWLLILPDVYEIGMSHQGLRILYDLLNQREDALADRAFAPWTDMEALMRRDGVPLFALESRRPARDFDVVGFSLQYELLATNILNMLDLAGIPLWSRERGEQDPLIAAGGPCTGNPEPLADFIDFFLIGDGEQAVARITEVIGATRGQTRRERLRALAEIPGLYVPCFYEPRYENGRQAGVTPLDGVPPRITRTYVRDLDGAPYPMRPLVSLTEAVQDRLTLEIQRGCTQGCRFCQAGIFYRPVRERSPRRLAELAAAGLAASGWNQVGLSSLSSADYSQIEPLARAFTEALQPARIGLSFSSLRVDTFSVELADLVSRIRKTGLTFAPEAGTERLRRVINKNIRDADVLSAVEAAYAKGWRRVKLYFMIGLPTETQDDLDGIVSITRRVREIGRRYGGSRSVTASVGSFVPKAHTPFQWEAFGERESLREKLSYLKEHTRSRWSQMKWHEVDPSFVEAVLARGDRRLARTIHRVWETGGRFDGWTDIFEMERWEEAFRETGIDPRDFTGAIDIARPLAWDHIDLGVEKSWLLHERNLASDGETTPDCRTARCTQCGMGGPRNRQFTPAPDAEEYRHLSRELSAAVSPTADATPVVPDTPSDGIAAEAHDTPTSPAVGIATAAAEAVSHRCRVVYSKRGPLRFISHLETGHLLIRLFRMARWPLVFTQGHRPRPKVSFGPPLPLGLEGDHELIDTQLTSAVSMREIERVNQRTPRGLEIISAHEIPRSVKSLTSETISALYRVAVPADLHEIAVRERRLEALREAESVIVLKPSKGRQRSIDLKRCVKHLQWEDLPRGSTQPNGAEPQSDGAWDGRILSMELLMQEPAGHVLGPLPALLELFKWSREDLGRCLVTRLRLLDASARPLHHPPAAES